MYLRTGILKYKPTANFNTMKVGCRILVWQAKDTISTGLIGHWKTFFN